MAELKEISMNDVQAALPDPTPWPRPVREGTQGRVFINGIMASTFNKKDPRSVARSYANILHIHKCVNMHDELLMLIKRLAEKTGDPGEIAAAKALWVKARR